MEKCCWNAISNKITCELKKYFVKVGAHYTLLMFSVNKFIIWQKKENSKMPEIKMPEVAT